MNNFSHLLTFFEFLIYLFEKHCYFQKPSFFINGTLVLRWRMVGGGSRVVGGGWWVAPRHTLLDHFAHSEHPIWARHTRLDHFANFHKFRPTTHTPPSQ